MDEMPNIHTPIDCTSFHACASCTVQRHHGHLVNSRQITERFSKQVRDVYLVVGVRDHGWLPLSVHLVIPVLRHLGLGVWDVLWLVPFLYQSMGMCQYTHTHTLLHINHTHCTQSQSYTNTRVWECANRHTHTSMHT